MPIPDADRATAAIEKVRDYLLNIEHADGGPKAIWFHTLGYDRSAWTQLARDLLRNATGSIPKQPVLE
jgi:hypothetical protein